MLNLCLTKKEISTQSKTFIKKGAVQVSDSISDSAILTKFNNDFHFHPLTQRFDLPKFHRKVAEIDRTSEGFTLIPHKTKLKSYFDEFWLVINKSSIPSLPLSKLDIIRVNNSCFLIKDLIGFHDKTIEKPEKTQNRESELSFKTDPRNTLTPFPEILIEVESFCRICLEDTQTQLNPFIKPCKCSGGMGFIHLECFDKWVDSKFNVKVFKFFKIISWDTLCCESCKQGIPDIVEYNSTFFDIFSRFRIGGKSVMFQKVDGGERKRNVLIVVDCNGIDKFFIHHNGFVEDKKAGNACMVMVGEDELVACGNEMKDFSFSVLTRHNIEMGKGDKFVFINGLSLLDFSVHKKFSLKSCLCCKA